MYEILDDDASGGLNFQEFQKNIFKLPGTSGMHMTQACSSLGFWV